jgi:hypothetical protein
MRFRRALAAFVLCAGAPAVAAAQEARRIEIGYEITFAGFSGFRIDFSAQFDGTRYDVESHTFKEGLLRILTIHYVGRNRAWGGFVPEGAKPTGGSLSIVVGDKSRTWLAQYGPDGSVREQHNPEWKPWPQVVIPEDKRRGSLDPLSGALSVGMAGDAACQQTVPSNDGRRRIDVVLRPVGTETPAQAGVPMAKGDLLVCEVHTLRVAGEFHDAPREAESKREQPMKLWFGRLDDTQFRFPVKLEAQTGFGTIRGKTLYFRERPLTEQERAGMRR